MSGAATCRTTPLHAPWPGLAAAVGAPDWPAEGAVPEVSRAVQGGVPVRLRSDADWPRGALPPAVSVRHVAAPTPAYTLWVTDRVVPLGAREAALRPPSLSVGVGAARGVRAGEVAELIERVLGEAGLSIASAGELVSVDAKAGEPGLLGAAERLGVPLRTFAANVLAAVTVPGPPSTVARAAVGTPSVAEAAALYAVSAAGGPGGHLLVPKRVSAPEGRTGHATAAVARRSPDGWLTASANAAHERIGGDGRARSS